MTCLLSCCSSRRFLLASGLMSRGRCVAGSSSAEAGLWHRGVPSENQREPWYVGNMSIHYILKKFCPLFLSNYMKKTKTNFNKKTVKQQNGNIFLKRMQMESQ